MSAQHAFVGFILSLVALTPGQSVEAQASTYAFRPARPPINLARHDPANAAIHQLHYCTEVQMVAWFNTFRGRYSEAQLEQAAASAVAKCDHLVDAATKWNIAVARQMAANPKLAERANAALAQYSFAEWRVDQVDRARRGAMSYIRGVRIATQPDIQDESRPAATERR